jgi:ribosomal protein S13
MRIAGVTLPDKKQLAYSLPIIYGIGPTRALDILKIAKIAPTKKGSELTPEEEQTIRALAEGFTIEDFAMLKDFRCVASVQRQILGQCVVTRERPWVLDVVH